ncbi:uncharacterized protein LOC113233291 [Hyposmocoma kahamanoa]|uniref:uncharacterized protein LOC113233291 n=1 Tax=Hyposmocoma kahamanoa TaxID=1477025 RepID=UPI000E6D9AB4|nr:uncharacterized protein LOC113233291 [Hyposmocoma kahamanoa]
MVENASLERDEQYVYLGHVLSFGKEHQPKKMSKRIQLAWVAFGKLNDILKSDNVPQCLKTRLLNQCLLPTMTYGEDIDAHAEVYMLKVEKRTMERAKLGIRLVDRVANVEIQRQTKFQDAGTRIMELQWGWTGHIAR